MRVGIVGAAGAMGGWFTSYFKDRADEVSVYDVNQRRLRAFANRVGVHCSRSLSELTSENELLLACVPIEETIKTVRAVLASDSAGKCVIEITSVKNSIVQSLRSQSTAKTRILSLHPLFGPGARGLDGNSIAVIPLRNGEEERRLAAEIFPEADTFLVDADLHDRIIALTVAGTFILNMSWLKLASGFDQTMVRRLMGPASRLQLIIAESYLAKDLELYASICRNNPYSSDVVEQLSSGLKKVLNAAENNDENLSNLVSDSAISDSEAYSDLYGVLDYLKSQKTPS